MKSKPSGQLVSKGKRPSSDFDHLRVGEGVPIAITLQAARDAAGGRAVTTFAADISSAPVPNRRYSADVWEVVYSRETFRVLFGQEMIVSGSLRTLLVINMVPVAVRQFLDSVDSASAGFNQIEAEQAISPEAPEQILEEPSNTVAFSANLVISAAIGRETCMDFYHASPFSKGAAVRTHHLAIDPIVRVDLRTGMALGLIKKLRHLLSGVPSGLAEV